MTIQYALDRDETTSVYSAAPTSLTSHLAKPNVGRLGAALDELNLDAQSSIHGLGGGRFEEEYDGGEEYREPLGHNVEHACR